MGHCVYLSLSIIEKEADRHTKHSMPSGYTPLTCLTTPVFLESLYLTPAGTSARLSFFIFLWRYK